MYKCPGCKKETFIPPNSTVVEHWCTCGYGINLIKMPESDNEIAKRLWDKYSRYVLDCQSEGWEPVGFPEWLDKEITDGN